MSDTQIESSTGTNSDINPDVEIKSMSQDRLDRKQYSRRIADRIRRAGDGPSVVFGLAGPWGSGKSSVLNMITEVLDQEYSATWSVVSFTPWSAGDTFTLTEEFYSAIASAMPPSEAGATAKRLLAAAAPAGAAVLKVLATSVIEKYVGKGAVKDALDAAAEAAAEQAGDFTPDEQPDPFSERFSEISDAIAEAGRNVLVIVDDVDRLHSDELLSVMKAVRLLGRFDRVHYLLSYDEDTVIDVLVETDIARDKRSRATKYLEKIVQYPFVLPPIQQMHLANEFREQLRAVAHSNKAAFTDDADDTRDDPGEDASDLVFALLPSDRLTLRSIYRLCNQVDVMLSLVGEGELDLVDATLLTFIRLEYRDLYVQLPRWRKELVGSTRSSGNNRNEVTPEQWKERITALLDLDQDSLEVHLLYGVLVSLFPALPRPRQFYVRSREATCQVRDDTYFERYFAFCLPVRDIRDSTVRSELAEFARTGSWPAQSLLLECLDDEPRRRLLRGKIMQSLDVIAGAPSLESANAAHLLTRAVPTDGRDLYFNKWSMVIYALLAHAISQATPETAEQIVANFHTEFDLPTTIDVFARPIDLPGVDSTKVVKATRAIREEVLRRSRQDLTTDLAPQDRHSHTIASFIHYLDDDLWMQISEQAQTLLASDDEVTLASLGARFVRMAGKWNEQTGKTEVWHHQFMSEEFAQLIPRERWSIEQLPEFESTALDFNDTSLGNRTTYAARALHELLAGQTPENT